MIGKKKKETPKGSLVYAVLPAAGTSSRMNGENKLMLDLCGKPVIRRTLEAFEACEVIDGIVISCREEQREDYHALYKAWGLTKPLITTAGGATREHSVYQGVLACPPEVGYVAIHDAARPFILPELIARRQLFPVWFGSALKLQGVEELLEGLQRYRSEERRVGKECRSRWSPYH